MNDIVDQEIKEHKRRIAMFMRRLYKYKLTTTSGGNISVLMRDNTILITPSSSDKGSMRSDEIGHMELEGRIIGPEFKPSIESEMHIAIYKVRPDVRAVVHAHPVTASAFSASNSKINTRYISESYAILGEIAYSEYFNMGTEDLADAVADAAIHANCVVMRNHGALTVGETLFEAFDRMEVLENAAQITLINEGHLTGQGVEISVDALRDIDHMMGRT